VGATIFPTFATIKVAISIFAITTTAVAITTVTVIVCPNWQG
jgi:hypothetical protein